LEGSVVVVASAGLVARGRTATGSPLASDGDGGATFLRHMRMFLRRLLRRAPGVCWARHAFVCWGEAKKKSNEKKKKIKLVGVLVDYKCADGGFSQSATCVTVSNGHYISSSETGVSAAIRS
jgi:hypothetical protein